MIYTDTIYIPVRRRPKNAGKNLSRKKSAGNLGRNHGSSSKQPILRGYKFEMRLPALTKRMLYLEINFKKYIYRRSNKVSAQNDYLTCYKSLIQPSLTTHNALRLDQFQSPLLQCRRNILFPAIRINSNARNSILKGNLHYLFKIVPKMFQMYLLEDLKLKKSYFVK